MSGALLSRPLEAAAISTISQVVYFFVARPAIRVLLRTGPEGPTARVVRDFARHAADFALAALAAPRRNRGSRRVERSAAVRRPR